MAKAKDQKAGSYAHQAHAGFAPAWNPSGLAPEAEKELASRGLIPKPAKTGARTRPPTAAARAPAGSARDLEAELPSRSKRKRELKSRHFRLPAEIDEKLDYLAKHYETTLVYVVCKALQEEWIRTMRQQRRDERAAAEGTPAPETDDEP